jgi:hypothetical protein
VEEIDHILLAYAFSQQVWHSALGVIGIDQVVFVVEDTFWTWWLRSRKLIPKELRRGFDSFAFLVGWNLWKERNSRTFNDITCSAAEVLRAIADEANLWMLAGFKQLHSLAVFANQSYIGFHVN